ncbi:MAG: hypothetical protein AAF558_10455 [Verrucomicrobiota bacterium]
MFKIPSLLFLLLLIYFGVYAGISSMGEYKAAASGNIKTPLIPINIADTRQWHPKFAELNVYKNSEDNWTWTGNTAGYVFAPLILLDRQFWHPTEKLFNN